MKDVYIQEKVEHLLIEDAAGRTLLITGHNVRRIPQQTS